MRNTFRPNNEKKNWILGFFHYVLKALILWSMHLCYFTIIFPWTRMGPLTFEQTWILFTQECIVQSLVEIGPVVLEDHEYYICKNLKKFTERIFQTATSSGLLKFMYNGQTGFTHIQVISEKIKLEFPVNNVHVHSMSTVTIKLHEIVISGFRNCTDILFQ